ncbi:uncharacterized protein LACBIDRAFT_334010 [Laccaria bicolor S238N-H82]|uniref:Predicted protein n=1 Tax=Laccaria bicolor (strain S238N-H82 / ATCC MYA-4686) TaxID=486041 RepID=B0DXS9_LACBS|nr:uncharacterized protein LACBIDRAFT_334010 [Laccaria bicolor S238N-H82]EDR00564.1 predicted protein [Laccaria bicolor S238N-H82]|eukprot:XP_001888791.1 predicted protein [Laccaria bicolor S238N-H82]
MAPMVLDVDPAIIVTALTCKAPDTALQPISGCMWTERCLPSCKAFCVFMCFCALFSSEFPALSPFWVAAAWGPAEPWPLGEIAQPHHRSVTLPDRLFRRSQPYFCGCRSRNGSQILD